MMPALFVAFIHTENTYVLTSCFGNGSNYTHINAGVNRNLPLNMQILRLVQILHKTISHIPEFAFCFYSGLELQEISVFW